MGTTFLPPGFRFHPTDQELIGYYLQRKVHGLEIELEIIPVIDLYKYDPWELPEKSFFPNRDMEWFFFCPRDRKYPNGSRANRATKVGYWKATGKDRKIVCQSSVEGCRKTLVFYRGRAPLGDRTDWIMHEYRLSDDNSSKGSSNSLEAFVLCRVVKRHELGHKTYDLSGETISHTLVSSSSSGDFTSSVTLNGSQYSSPIASPYPVQPQPVTDFQPPSIESDPSSLLVSHDMILDSSKDYTQRHEIVPKYPSRFEYSSTMRNHGEFSPSTISFSNFSGEIETADDLNQFNYMSPYSEYGYCMGYYGSEDMPYQGH